MKRIELKELLDRNELKEVEKLIKKKDFGNLKTYLRDRKEKLEKKGVLADYLYYYLLCLFEK